MNLFWKLATMGFALAAALPWFATRRGAPPALRGPRASDDAQTTGGSAHELRARVQATAAPPELCRAAARARRGAR